MPPSLWIDDQPVSVPPGTTLLAAIRQAGGDVPTLCHSPFLPPSGHCRLCLVEVGGGKPVAACHAIAREGQRCRTRSEALDTARRGVLGFLLRNHPRLCHRCQGAGACQLRRVIATVGLDWDKLPPPQPQPRMEDHHPFILRDPERCIQCHRCVRACQLVQGSEVLGFLGRGEASRLAAGADESLLAAGCQSCGQCVVECPVGALRERAPADTPPPEKVVATTCGYCAVGCGLNVATARGKILFSRPNPSATVNRGHACVKGRFGMTFATSPERLTHPLVRRDGVLREASWEEACAVIVERLSRTPGDRFALVASARCTNEENFIFQKFTRVVMGSNHVDNCARVCHSPSAFALAAALGTAAGTNGFDDLDQARAILLVGANPTEAHPVLGARLRQAVRQGCELVVLDPRRTELARLARLHLPLKPGSNGAVINAMQHTILEEGWWDPPFVVQHGEGLEALRESLAGCTPAWAAPIAGVEARAIVEAARIYARAKPAQIFWGLGVTESCQGTLAAFGLINLTILTGNLGQAGGGANPIRGQNNVQGACDVGALPNLFSDYRALDDETARAEHLARWGRLPAPQPGFKIPQMLEAAREGRLDALYVAGQDLAQSDPDTRAVEEALARVPFLVVQELFPGATSRFAQVVLPAASFLEKEGTFVNSDRRIQRVRRVLAPPGQARPDGQILHDLAARMGVDLGFAPDGVVDPALVMEEIAALSPNWRGVSYARLEALGFLQWPCPSPDHPGTAVVHAGGETLRGRARLTPTPWRAAGTETDADYPFLLTTGRILYHYNVGSMTRRTGILALSGEEDEAIRFHPDDAARLGIRPGERVRLVSPEGSLERPAALSRELRPGMLFLSFHFPENGANRLLGQQSDPYTRCPEYKVIAVRVEPPAGRAFLSTPV